MLVPASAQGLIDGHDIHQAARVRLNAGHRGLEIGCLGVQKNECADVAELELALRNPEQAFGELLLVHGRQVLIGIVLHGLERVCNVLECVEHRAAVQRQGLIGLGLRGAVAMQQRPALEQGLREAGADAPQQAAWVEQFREGLGARAIVCGQRQLREHVGQRHAKLGVGRMHLCLGGANVGPAFDQVRGQARRHIGQAQCREIERRRLQLGRQRAHQHRQQIALLRKLFFQAGSRSLGLAEQGLLGEHRSPRRSAQALLYLKEFPLPSGNADQALRGRELIAQ